MSFWQQVNQLLSEAPGSLVYHLVTLFAIQATLAISLSQWRRERQQDQTPLYPDGDLARRLTLASLGLLLSRFAFMVVSLVVAANPDRALPPELLPPLEQAVNSVTVVLIVWALVPQRNGQPRTTDVVAILALLFIGVMYVFFAQDWADRVEPGVTYNGTLQATLWGIFQLAVLGVGALLLVLTRFPDGGLRLFPVLILLAAHTVHFVDFPESIPSNSEIPFWIRLGQLAAFPLLAVLAYRHSLQQLLASQLRHRPAPEQVAATLGVATDVLAAPTAAERAQKAVAMVADLTRAAFAAVALPVAGEAEQLDVTSKLQDGEPQRPWRLKLDDWPALRMAMEQRESIELHPDGLGARQLHDLYQEMGVPMAGPLLITPLLAEEGAVGALLLGGPPDGGQWSAAAMLLIPSLAAYVAQASGERAPLESGQAGLETVGPAVAEPVGPTVAGAVGPAVAGAVIGTGRIIALEEERDRALDEVNIMRAKLEQAHADLLAAQQQSKDLAATIEELERSRAAGSDQELLETEVATLREALIEAEEAMAMAAAAESELSTEWVTNTITRYSGELEEAMVRIEELEAELANHGPVQGSAVVTSLAQELRTPLTSIAGYTDLLLGETIGILGTRQRDFLQRVRANVERMGVLLDQIIQLAATPVAGPTVANVELVDLNEVIENAVNTVITQLRRKDLRLNLSIDEGLPPVPANRDALAQVFIHLLSNASQASVNQGEMTISAHADTVQSQSTNGAHAKLESFVHVAISDSGVGIKPEDRALVFDPQHRADHALIVGLGDTGAGLSVAHSLVTAHGGRMWVDSDSETGSTFSLLLPCNLNGEATSEGDS